MDMAEREMDREAAEEFYANCEHVKTKPKLIAWATKSRHGHRQGFRIGLCCVACGKEITK